MAIDYWLLAIVCLQASTSGNVGVINLLLKKGADVTVTDKDGVSTLMSAASHGHAQVRADKLTCYGSLLLRHRTARMHPYGIPGILYLLLFYYFCFTVIIYSLGYELPGVHVFLLRIW